MRNISFFLGALLLVDGVFGDDETVSVMEGDSVTLKHHTVIPEDDSADWWFGDEIIAIKETDGVFSISEGDKVGFKDRLNVDKHNGSLTITNIRTKDTGDYKLKISGRTETTEIFRVTVTDAVESVLVTEGETVTLHTGVTGIQRDDQIQWKFGGVLIADLNGADARWSNTDLKDKTGDLTIRNIRRNQYGDYEVEIKNKNSLILHKKFRITPVSDKQTPDPGVSPGAVAGIVVLLVVIAAVLAAGLIYYRRKYYGLQKQLDIVEKNGTNVPMNDETALETANSDDL
ncbi:hypothetical protein R3I93_016961 [Phoxinus phoxinus]|uniref:Ig-like domain-containing protein n=1 Tax=Phoxinus phoxinus TaxID=58324 RepID=A0AAN9CGU0_9TELE